MSSLQVFFYTPKKKQILNSITIHREKDENMVKYYHHDHEAEY